MAGGTWGVDGRAGRLRHGDCSAFANRRAGSRSSFGGEGQGEEAVRLHNYAAAQIVENEGLVRFGKTEFHGIPACMMLETGEAPVPPS